MTSNSKQFHFAENGSDEIRDYKLSVIGNVRNKTPCSEIEIHFQCHWKHNVCMYNDNSAENRSFIEPNSLQKAWMYAWPYSSRHNRIDRNLCIRTLLFYLNISFYNGTWLVRTIQGTFCSIYHRWEIRTYVLTVSDIFSIAHKARREKGDSVFTNAILVVERQIYCPSPTKFHYILLWAGWKAYWRGIIA